MMLYFNFRNKNMKEILCKKPQTTNHKPQTTNHKKVTELKKFVTLPIALCLLTLNVSVNASNDCSIANHT